MRYTVLIAEDDSDIIDMISLYLDQDIYQILRAGNGIAALDCMKTEKVDIALVDLMMPEMDGFELIREIRKNYRIPIIILSAKSFDTDKVKALNLGADAYLTKPFSPFELVAYVKAALRRYYHWGSGEAVQEEKKLITSGQLELDCEQFVLRKNGETVPLTGTEFKILNKLMSHPGRVYTKAQLLECITCDTYSETDDNTITVHIYNLRSKIEERITGHTYIKTIRGLGYKFEHEKTETKA